MNTRRRNRLIRDKLCIACTQRPISQMSALYCNQCTATLAQINTRQATDTYRAAQFEARRYKGASV